MLFIFVVIVLFAGIVSLKAARYRRLARIAVHPRVGELARSQAPAKLKRLLDALEPHLVQSGFQAFGNVRTVEFRESLIWTGQSFFNRETGERLGIIDWSEPAEKRLVIVVVTKIDLGRQVATHWVHPTNAVATTGGGGASAIAGPSVLTDLRDWHRKRVEEATVEQRTIGIPTPPGRVLPSPENERQWFRTGADQMAAEVAASLNYRMGFPGRYYWPPWREAFQWVLRMSPTEDPRASHGFEVIVAPKQAMPLEADAGLNRRSEE